MGNSLESYDLERSVARWLGRDDSFLCPTGWAAGFAAVSGVVRPDDHVVMDELSHQCLQQGAYASTTNVRNFKHLDNEDLEAHLRSIRETDARNAILVITEGLFSMDGDAPDLRTLVAICRRYGALVLVDVAHDLGASGPNGTGTVGDQGLLAEIDIIVGAFSKTFASNGGFISSKALSVQWTQLCFGGPYTYSTAMSPIQVAVAREALRIVSSSDGEDLRNRLDANVRYVRAGAAQRGLTVLGAPSAIVPILIGREQHSRLAGMLSFQKGLIAVCLEFPVVQRGAARFRFSMSPRHSHEQMDRALDIVAESIAEANAALD
jgi:7-keto-8-aminopelargonate synthetase-like enzyme